MEIGDIVRLKQPFRPEPDCVEEYSYGVVVGLVEIDRDNSNRDSIDPNNINQDNIDRDNIGRGSIDRDDNTAWRRSSFSEVVVQLYNPETSTVYTDEFGSQPLFYFRVDELGL